MEVRYVANFCDIGADVGVRSTSDLPYYYFSKKIFSYYIDNAVFPALLLSLLYTKSERYNHPLGQAQRTVIYFLSPNDSYKIFTKRKLLR